MESTRVRLFTTTGQRLPDVVLPISKTEASVRLLRRIAKSEDSGFTGRLADLDSGRLEFTLLRKLFTRPEIEKAVKQRLMDPSLSESERGQLTRILQDKSLWTAAQGGEDAMRGDRFGIGRNPGHDPDSKGSIRKSLERRDLVKSMAFEGATSEAKSCGWKVSRSTPGGGLAFHHPKFNGHELTVDTRGNFEHEKRGGEKLAAGEHGELMKHLSAFHGSKD